MLTPFLALVKSSGKKAIAKISDMLEHTAMSAKLSSPHLSTLRKFILRKNIENFARKIGFDLVGFSPAKIEEKYLQPFEDWLKEGRNGTMEYMKKIEQRRDLTQILPGAKSVIVLAMNYYNEQKPLQKNSGRIARYAPGRDYHKIIKKLSNQLRQHIEGLGGIARAYVDTGPILERALAEQAGLGRIGKNTCLITKEYGSWVFLAEIITTLDLLEKIALPGERLEIYSDGKSKVAPGQLSQPDRWQDPKAKSFNVCGNCNRCITACPTGAIIAPGVVDARLCISYLTIENKDKIPPKLAKIIKKTKRLYGCDICQEVCPHNHARQKDINNIPAHQAATLKLAPKSNLATSTNFIPSSPLSFANNPQIAGDQLNLKSLTNPTGPLFSDQHFLKTFAGSALMRTKRKGLQRNATAITK